MKVNILGIEYTIERRKIEDDKALQDNCDGYTDHTVKLIVVEDFQDDGDPLAYKNLKEYGDRCIRHEIIHAFLDESGLQQCSQWARNEEMVDYFAIQFPKILKAFEEAGAIKREIISPIKDDLEFEKLMKKVRETPIAEMPVTD